MSAMRSRSMETVAYLKGEGTRDPRLHEVVDGAGRRDAGAGRSGAERRRRPGARRGGAGGRPRGGEVRAAWWRRWAGRTISSSIPAAISAHAPVIKPCTAERPGHVVGMNAREVGIAVVALGGGRSHADDAIDPSVGLSRVHRCRHAGPDRQPALPRPCRERGRRRRGDRAGAPGDPHRRPRAAARPVVIDRIVAMNAADLAAYERDGFLVLQDFLPPADCDALQARAAELVAGFDPGPARTIFSTRDQGHARDRYFRESGGAIRFFFEEEATAIAAEQDRPCAARSRSGVRPHLAPAAACRRSRTSARPGRSRCCCSRCTSSSSRGIGGEVGWHQDATYLHTTPVTVTGFWIALDDADRDNGCLMALPGAPSRAVAPALPPRGRGDGHRRRSMPRHGRPIEPVALEVAARHAGRAARPAAACQQRQPLGPAAPCLCLAPDRRRCRRMQSDNWLQRPDLPLRGFA